MPKRRAARKGRTLYIKNPVAHRLAEQVSKRLGVTMSDAVIRSLEAQVKQSVRSIDRAQVDQICRRLSALPVLDPRPADEILGYGALGLPQT